MGSLTHGVVLQGGRYEAAIDVWGDGLRLALEEPYVAECRLRVRIGKCCRYNIIALQGLLFARKVGIAVALLNSLFAMKLKFAPFCSS